MKITQVNTYFVRPRWGFVEILTDEGIDGWGEAVLEGHCSAVLACVQEMKTYLIGADPMRIEDIWHVLYRCGFYRGGGVLMSAISGIDQALWDIKGKHFNAPVYELMGGACRDNMKVYSWIGGDRPSDTGAAALEKKNAGFTAVKMNATEELQIVDTYDKVDAVLDVAGDEGTEALYFAYLNEVAVAEGVLKGGGYLGGSAGGLHAQGVFSDGGGGDGKVALLSYNVDLEPGELGCKVLDRPLGGRLGGAFVGVFTGDGYVSLAAQPEAGLDAYGGEHVDRAAGHLDLVVGDRVVLVGDGGLVVLKEGVVA